MRGLTAMNCLPALSTGLDEPKVSAICQKWNNPKRVNYRLMGKLMFVVTKTKGSVNHETHIHREGTTEDSPLPKGVRGLLPFQNPFLQAIIRRSNFFTLGIAIYQYPDLG